jgi:PleD family two-component response regulator
MPRILIAADKADSFEELARALDSVKNVQILWAHDNEEALVKAAADSPDLVIVDEHLGQVSGLQWIRRLMGINAFIHTAAVSSQPHDVFHEASEGLGVMAHLPPRPGKFEAEQLLKTLNQLMGA